MNPDRKRKRKNPKPGIVSLKVADPLPSAKIAKTVYEDFITTGTKNAEALPLNNAPSVEVVEPLEDSSAPTQTQGASSKLEPFTPEILKEIQDEILSLEADEAVNKQCHSCSTSSNSQADGNLVGSKPRALYRCLECFTHVPMCSDCIIKCHRDQPFHRIQRWTGRLFEKAALSDLGHVLFFGHQGHRCPNNKDSPNNFVVVHTNGTHDCKILYCQCNPLNRRQDKALQLIRHQLFPPSLDLPQTVFTFTVLKDFDRHSLNAKSSNYDYHKTLKEYTDAAFPGKTHHRYKEFNIVMRLWRHLTLRRRSGQDFNIDSLLSHRRSGCLALRCPACPEVGFNIEEWVIELARDNHLHKYTLFLSADGNFRLQRKRKIHDRLDKSLNAGNGYFVEDSKYRHYIKSLRNEVDTSLCAKLKAVRQQDRSKFKDAEVSGVIAIQCARHGFYLPQGMADLDKEEAYIKTDYVLMHALGPEGANQRWISVSYDIWCQYHINLPKRITANLPDFAPYLKYIRGSVPKMHIHGHNVDCQINHSFVYERHSGMTHGEAIESAWSEQNHAASFTKEQNPGHRQETLDNFNGHYNFCKLRQLSSDLSQRRRRAKVSYEAKKDSFDTLTSSISAKLVELWRAVEAQASKSELYQVQGKMPTRQQAISKSLERENGTMPTGLTEFIRRGLEIEILQMNYPQTDVSDEDLDHTHLVDLLKIWRVDQHELFPFLPHLSLTSDEAPHATNLQLPSSFSSEERKMYKLGEATEIEIALRRGYAFDVLSDLRDVIHEINHAMTEKRTNLSSQSIATRSQRHISEIRSRMLGPNATEGLQSLEVDQLWGKNIFIPHTTGDSSKQNPWFWSVGRPEGMLSNDWLIELERVRWYREKAAVDRLREELEILEEEFRRTYKSFTRMNEVWQELAILHENRRGYPAYAWRQADIYSKFANECLFYWKDIRTFILDFINILFETSGRKHSITAQFQFIRSANIRKYDLDNPIHTQSTIRTYLKAPGPYMVDGRVPALFLRSSQPSLPYTSTTSTTTIQSHNNMPNPQTQLPVYMYTSVNRKNIELNGIPTYIAPFIRWVWADIMEYATLKGITTHLKGFIGTGTYEADGDIPRIQISFFDGADTTIGTLTVYNEIDDFALEFVEDTEWGHGCIEELKLGFVVPLDT
ncbi:hypothetical protein Agabi119p4_11222 [Agaricus bisporus var. burnettii]|uniref:CxC2-like cysteine cluster KDZ transposase-associated domain-containing protein n=1 Tax=Agaricus bisporus var. burnettii TaxID=192524 RepID=A0A8H7C1E3_AGABI|nr:hypothetical protein Agabi119p4_11222 [Agaricus bisporus var. burnettii]